MFEKYKEDTTDGEDSRRTLSSFCSIEEGATSIYNTRRCHCSLPRHANRGTRPPDDKGASRARSHTALFVRAYRNQDL